MMSIRGHIVTCGFLVAALTGCPSESKPAPEGATTTTGTTGPKSSAKVAGGKEKLSDEEVDKEDIPTQEDFEEEVRKQISDENYLDELEKIEGEIDADK